MLLLLLMMITSTLTQDSKGTVIEAFDRKGRFNAFFVANLFATFWPLNAHPSSRFIFFIAYCATDSGTNWHKNVVYGTKCLSLSVIMKLKKLGGKPWKIVIWSCGLLRATWDCALLAWIVFNCLRLKARVYLFCLVLNACQDISEIWFQEAWLIKSGCI